MCMSTGAAENLSLRIVGKRRDRAGSMSAGEVEELFKECEGRLGKYLVQLVGDRSLAEDLLQETFHDAYRGRRELAEARNPVAWLFGIARNHGLSALRRRRRGQRVLEQLGRQDAVHEYDYDQELVALRDLLERNLTADDRALLLLRYLHGFNAAELGEMIGLTREAVRQRLTRARTRLLAASEAVKKESEEVK